MESVIFAGLLISGYFANKCNDNNDKVIKNKSIEQKKRIIQKKKEMKQQKKQIIHATIPLGIIRKKLLGKRPGEPSPKSMVRHHLCYCLKAITRAMMRNL